jgi:hypothetical protein
MISVTNGSAGGSLETLAGFRWEFYQCLTARADVLFLTDAVFAVLRADGPVTTLVGLSLVPEHRRGHGALYDGLARRDIGVSRLRCAVEWWPYRDPGGSADGLGDRLQSLSFFLLFMPPGTWSYHAFTTASVYHEVTGPAADASRCSMGTYQFDCQWSKSFDHHACVSFLE